MEKGFRRGCFLLSQRHSRGTVSGPGGGARDPRARRFESFVPATRPPDAPRPAKAFSRVDSRSPPDPKFPEDATPPRILVVAMSESSRPPSLSAEIGPPLFPDVGKVAKSGGGLLRTLFGLAPPNSHSTMVSNSSFSTLPFVGGEEDAQDFIRDKYEAHRRAASLDEPRAPRDASTPGTVPPTSTPRTIPHPHRASGQVFAVASGAASGAASPPSAPHSFASSAGAFVANPSALAWRPGGSTLGSSYPPVGGNGGHNRFGGRT